jgi:hypothetical protein
MHYTLFIYDFDPIMMENLLVVLCLADKTLVDVEWQVPLVRFRAFYTLVRDWNVVKLE